MQLTRRGYAVAGLFLVVEVLAWTYGARALNAVAAPALVALAAAALVVSRREDPRVERTPPAPGFPGDTRRVTLTVEGAGFADVTEAVPERLTARGTELQVSLPATRSYELTYGERGAFDLGPTTVRTRDPLGLVEEVTTLGDTTEVLVYPTVYQLDLGRDLVREVLGVTEVERQEFDSLREYVPGDPLRDVHWKTTAKQPGDMLVREFAEREFDETVTVAARAERGYADEMATAAASIALTALDQGFAVELAAPYVTVPAGDDEAHRERMLEVLARTDAGSVTGSVRESADVFVDAGAGGVSVRFGDRDRTLEEMTVSRENPFVSPQEVTA